MHCPDCECRMRFSGVLNDEDVYWCPECKQEYPRSDANPDRIIITGTTLGPGVRERGI